MYLEFSVENQVLINKVVGVVASGSENYLKAKFTFSKDWDDIHKIAQFKNNMNLNTIPYEIEIIDGECTIPYEVLRKQGAFFVSVRGYNDEGIKPTTTVVRVKVKEGATSSGQLPSQPTLSLFDQVVNTANFCKNQIDNFLLSVANGDFKGEKGDTGDNTTVKSVKDFGAVGDGIADDTAAFNAAIAGGGKILAPSGTYLISSTITLPLHTYLVGDGSKSTIIKYTGSGKAFMVGSTTVTGFPLSMYGKLANLCINGPGVNTVGSCGVFVAKTLFFDMEDVYVNDMESGFIFDGYELWCASCNLYDLKTNKVKYGLTLTATSTGGYTGQTNHVNTFGGYFYGQSPIIPGSYGVKVVEGDNNCFFGTAAEDMDTGFWVVSNAPLGHRFFGVRTEGITTDRGIVVENGSIRNTFIGCNAPVNYNGMGSEGYNTEIADYGTFPTVTSLPLVGQWNRRKIVRLDGGSTMGFADNIYLSRKKKDDTYEWVPLIDDNSKPLNVLVSPSGIPYTPTISDTGILSYAFTGKAYDLFNRADSTITMGSATIGGAWTAVGGTWGIISNMAYSVTSENGNRCVLPSVGTHNHSIACDVLGTISNYSIYDIPQVCFRKIDDNNYWKIYLANGQIWLEKQIGGINTVCANKAVTTLDNTLYNLKAECSGASIKVYVGNALQIDYTMASDEITLFNNASAGTCGLRISKAGSPGFASRFKNLVIT